MQNIFKTNELKQDSVTQKIRVTEHIFFVQKKCNQIQKSANIYVKDIFKKEFRSKLEIKNRKIYTYIEQDELLIEKIIEDYMNYIYSIIINMARDLKQEDIEEIMQDVILTLWKNQDKLDINKSMSAYLSGITKNLVKYKCRQRKIHTNIDDWEEQLSDFKNLDWVIEKNEREKIISQELETLKENDREIFIKYYYYEKSIKEISNFFNMSESKIKSKLFRIRKILRKALKKGGYGYYE